MSINRISDEKMQVALQSDKNNGNFTWRPEHAVVQLVEALRSKPEGRGFDSRWCHWNFSLT